jgi:hypothetical protein
MKRIQINQVQATLRLMEWSCSQPQTLKMLQTLTREVVVTGSTPDVEDLVLNTLKRRIPFEIIDAGEDPAVGDDEVF